jgi:hypothetical protein
VSSDLRILGSLTYVLIPKLRRKGKLADKANKGILIGFNSSNNFLVYVPSQNRVINSRNVAIKEELEYKDDFIIEEDYSNLIENQKYDNLTNSTFITNSEDTTSNLEDIDELSTEFYKGPTTRSRASRTPTSNMSLYSLAFIAFLSSLNKGARINDNSNNLLP